jgi:hypothetical protein
METDMKMTRRSHAVVRMMLKVENMMFCVCVEVRMMYGRLCCGIFGLTVVSVRSYGCYVAG